MLRIVPHTVPNIGRSYEHFPDGFELHLLPRNPNRHRWRAGGNNFNGLKPFALEMAPAEARIWP